MTYTYLLKSKGNCEKATQTPLRRYSFKKLKGCQPGPEDVIRSAHCQDTTSTPCKTELHIWTGPDAYIFITV